jgi:Fic family protein
MLQPLGRFEERFWARDYSAPAGRRKAGAYRAFIPDRIAEREFVLASGAVQAVAEATSALAHLQGARVQLTSLWALARSLLRSESAASSRIEGVQISHRRLARALYIGAKGRGDDRRAAEVLGNVEAMERAIELGQTGQPLHVRDILEIHRTLLRYTEDQEIAGVMRARQNWIGGSDWHPIGAVYVPPPPEFVTGLLQDLCAFASRTDIAPVAQAAILHAQFENIHPFADGNGRVGRALIYSLLRRRGDLANYLPPISLALGAEPKGYVAALGAYSAGEVSIWCELFATATVRAVRDAEDLAAAIGRRQAVWLERLGNPRRDAVVRQIIAALPGTPVVDVPAVQQLTGRSHVAVGNAISQLEQVGVLRLLSERKWGRVWECPELFALVEEIERRIATPLR